MNVRFNANDDPLCLTKIWWTWIQYPLSIAGEFTPDELHAGLCKAFLFDHIRQMEPTVDADAKSLVSAGDAARRVGSRWTLPHI